jgi:DNA-binding FadR family transcriptional regulator
MYLTNHLHRAFCVLRHSVREAIELQRMKRALEAKAKKMVSDAYLWPSHNAPPFSLQWYHGEADEKTRLIRITERSLSSYSAREGVSCRN